MWLPPNQGRSAGRADSFLAVRYFLMSRVDKNYYFCGTMPRITACIWIFLLSLTGTITGQPAQNPFDLLHRKGDPSAISPDTTGIQPDSLSDVNRKDTITVEVTHMVVPGQDTRPTLANPSEVLSQDIQDSILRIAGPEISPEERLKYGGTNDVSPPETPDSALESKSTDDSLQAEEVIQFIPPQAVKRERMSGAFLALVFLGILLLLTIIVNINRKLLNQVYRASLNENFSSLLYRESKHSSFNYLYTIAYIIFFINAGLFIYLVQFLDIWFRPATYAFWVLILFPVLVYSTRHLVMHVLAAVFPITKEANQFNFNIIIFNIMIGLFLIPVNLFIAFGPSFLHLPIMYTSIVAIGLFYIFRQLRGVLIATPLLSHNLFLFFIYLCTVEILPLAVIFKLIA